MIGKRRWIILAIYVHVERRNIWRNRFPEYAGMNFNLTAFSSPPYIWLWLIARPVSEGQPCYTNEETQKPIIYRPRKSITTQLTFLHSSCCSIFIKYAFPPSIWGIKLSISTANRGVALYFAWSFSRWNKIVSARSLRCKRGSSPLGIANPDSSSSFANHW